MSLIVIGTDKMCTCNCAMKCVTQHKSGSMSRCTKQEIENAGFKTVELHSEKDDKIIQEFLCNDGDGKKIRLDLVRNSKVRRKILF
jgi:hypothetical protein